MQSADMIIKVEGDRIVAYFPYDPDLVLVVKGITGRKWDPMMRCWSWPASPVLARKIVSVLAPYGFQLHPSLPHLVERMETLAVMSRAVNGPVIPGLYPFQAAAVAYAETVGGRVIIADEMGIGKTVEGIAVVCRFEATPCVVVCPASVKRHWARHIETWAHSTASVIEGRDRTPPVFPAPSWIVVNYEILEDHLDEIAALHPKAVIVDESTFVKNPKADRTKAVGKLTDGVPVIVALDGTPLPNRPVELYNLLHLVNPSRWPDFFGFAFRFCGPVKGRFGWSFDGAENLEELQEELRTSVMIRRTKDQVLTDLPAKTRTLVPVDIAFDKYTRLDDEMTSAAKNAYRLATPEAKATALSKVEALRKCAVKLKMPQVHEWIRTFLASGRPLVVFSHHRSVAAEIAAKHAGALYSGERSRGERDEAVDDFQAGKFQLLSLTIDAGGVGITLHRAQECLFVEEPWTWAKLEQAEDRLHRIGQRGAVNVTHLYARGTVEEEILDLLETKRQMGLDALDVCWQNDLIKARAAR